ncbi:hypothetical protein B0H13DRAFT_1874023, partial [Mycena leptocephala]
MAAALRPSEFTHAGANTVTMLACSHGLRMASGCDKEVTETAMEVFSGRLLDVVNALGRYLTSEEDPRHPNTLHKQSVLWVPCIQTGVFFAFAATTRWEIQTHTCLYRH